MSSAGRSWDREAKGRLLAPRCSPQLCMLLDVLIVTAGLTPLSREKIYLYWPEADFAPPAFIRNPFASSPRPSVDAQGGREEAETLRGCQLR